MSFYMGVDPGASGAAVVIDANKEVDCLVLKDKTIADIVTWFGKWGDTGGVFALLEKVHAFPGTRKRMRCRKCGEWMSVMQAQGVASSFKFGQSFGILEAALVAARIPFILITPAQWQRTMGVPKKKKGETRSAHKNKLKGMAQRLYPNSRITLAKADAFLLAELSKMRNEDIPF